MACATTVHHIFMSRFLSGIAGAGIFFVVPVYVAEISDKKIRGFLSTVISVVCNLGILVEFILADYVDFKDVAKVVVAISIIFVIGFAFMPESPQYLVSRTRVEEAEVAFKYYRGLSAKDELPQYLVDDFKAIREIGIANEDEVKGLRGILEHISKPGVLKGVFMTIVVTHFPVFSGCFVFITYNQGIFRGADLKILTVFWSSIAFAVIQMVASMITAKFVDRLGRRTILIWSAFSSALCLAVFAAYMYLKDQLGLDFTSIPWITWIPLLSFLLEVLTSNIGIISVPNFYAPEILDQKVNQFCCNAIPRRIIFVSIFQIRSSIFSFCSWWAWIVGFLQIRYYPYIELSIGLHGVMLVFSLLCVFCGTFTLFVLPETKGRTIEEIALSIIKQ